MKTLDQKAFGHIGLDRSYVYGWRSSVNLAHTQHAKVMVSLENYAAFAVTSYWSKWYWASGKAKLEAEPLDFDPVRPFSRLQT